MAADGEKVLVTGGFGAIGSHVLRRLVGMGHQPVVYSRRESYALVPELRGKVTFAGGDVEDAERLRSVLREHGIRRVIHMAAALPSITEKDPVKGYQINVIATLKMFDAVRDLGLGRLVFASSKAAYGKLLGDYNPPVRKPVPEDYVGQTWNFYGATKKALEDAAHHYRRSWGVDLIALRLGSTYGPGKGSSTVGGTHVGYSAMKTHILEASLRGEPVEVTMSEVADDVVYNGDVAKGAVLAAFAPKPEHWQFNIASGQLVTLRQFAEEVQRQLPESRITIQPGVPNEVPPGNSPGLMDITRARTELGYAPDYPGIKGIAAYIQRARELEQAAAGV